MRKKIGLFSLIIIGGLMMHSSVLAQRTAETAVTVTEPTSSESTVGSRTVENPPSVPGVLSLFFRDIGQRIQLLVSINSIRDTSLRLEFAADNVALANQMLSMQSDRVVYLRAKALAVRAEEFVAAVTRTQDQWSKGDPDALADLSAKADAYFLLAGALVNQVNAGTFTGEMKTELQATMASLVEQNEQVKQVFAAKAVVKNTTPLRPAITPPENDADADGLDDTDELTLGLRVDNFDSDADGISDRMEMEKFGTDPTKSDTDGDGYLDGLEIIKGFNPVGEGLFSIENLQTNGFVFVKNKVNLPALSPATLQLLQEASEGKKLERYTGTN